MVKKGASFLTKSLKQGLVSHVSDLLSGIPLCFTLFWPIFCLAKTKGAMFSPLPSLPWPSLSHKSELAVLQCCTLNAYVRAVCISVLRKKGCREAESCVHRLTQFTVSSRWVLSHSLQWQQSSTVSQQTKTKTISPLLLNLIFQNRLFIFLCLDPVFHQDSNQVLCACNHFPAIAVYGTDTNTLT